MKKIIIAILGLILVCVVAYFVLSRDTKVTGRIDFETSLVNKDVPQFEVYVNGSEKTESQTSWMPKFNKQGYIVQTDDGNIDVVVKSLTNNEIKVSLRGPDKHDENNNMVPVWVKYTSMVVNGEQVLPEPVDAWHNKPFVYSIDAKNGDEYKIQIKWTKSDK